MLPILPLLLKIPLLKSVVSFFTLPSFRLILEYGLIAALVTASGAAYHMWSTRAQAIELGKRLKLERDISNQHLGVVEASLVLMQKARLEDALQIAELEEKRLAEAKRAKSIASRIAKLEKENENVRLYLNSRIPPELACVLNRTCPANSDKDRAPETVDGKPEKLRTP